jgi:hypothetical protein
MLWEQTNTGKIKLIGVLYRDCSIPRLIRNTKCFDLRTGHPDGFRQINAWLLGKYPPVPPPQHLPQRPPLFIGRETEIVELRRHLAEPGAVVAVPGLPGLGKTTLALEYAHRHYADFETVHWLPCVGGNLAAIAGELGFQLGLKFEGDLEKILHDLKAHCAAKRCLIVLDNVEDEAPGALIPAGRASVLITTRREPLEFLGLRQPVKPKLFNDSECLKLFRDVLGEAEVARAESAALALFVRLGHLPIAISVAARLIQYDVRYTIEKFPRFDPLDLFKTAIAATQETERNLIAAMAACAAGGFRLSLAAEIAGLDEIPRSMR